jgi:hypothetical protein
MRPKNNNIKHAMTYPLQKLGFALLCTVLLGGCSKSPRGPELTMADIETTNPPPVTSTARTRFDAMGGSKVRIEGTSNIHDWQCQSSLIGGFIEVGANFPTEPGQAVTPGKADAQVQAFIPVRGLKSVEKDGKPYSDKMDDIMYEKLKVTESPRILYFLDQLTLKEAPKANGTPYLFEATGKLVIAGVTNTVSMPVSVLPLEQKRLKLSGSVSVKMTSFGIEPPSPTFLPIKTGDEVKLLFDWMVGVKTPVATAK